MAGIARSRRRRLWLAVAVLLPVVGAMAWQYRPLNVTERLLVGLWKAPTEDLDEPFPVPAPRRHLEAIRFTADRRYRHRGDFLLPLETGAWRVTGSSLYLDPDPAGPWSYDRLVVATKKLLGRHPGRRVYRLILASPPVAFHMESPSHSVYWTQDTEGRGAPLVGEPSASGEPVDVGLPTR